jgi:4-carboxymuconolactone decarboxylase
MPAPAERVPRLTPHDDDPERAALRDALTGGPRSRSGAFPLAHDDGSLVGPFGLMLHVPHLGGPLQELGAAIRFRTTLSDRHREIAILVVAAATASEFEWWAHSRLAPTAGLTEAEVAAIRTAGEQHALTDGSDRVVATLSRMLCADEDVDDALWVRAEEAIGATAIHEVVVLVGYYRLLAQWMGAFRIGPPTA